MWLPLPCEATKPQEKAETENGERRTEGGKPNTKNPVVMAGIGRREIYRRPHMSAGNGTREIYKKENRQQLKKKSEKCWGRRRDVENLAGKTPNLRATQHVGGVGVEEQRKNIATVVRGKVVAQRVLENSCTNFA